MRDGYEREIDYLRISLTNQCNLRCSYCVGEEPCIRQMLSKDQVIHIVKAAAGLGIRHIRLTGGEPTIHPDLISIIREIRTVSGIETISLTTNGVLLSLLAKDLKEAGLDRINVSLDTLDPKRFQELTGVDCLDRVVNGIACAVKMGLKVRINSVILQGEDWLSLAKFSENQGVILRFIERMPFGEMRTEDLVSYKQVKASLEAYYGEAAGTKEAGNGPAFYLRFANKTMAVGFITAMEEPFCESCNRIRVTSDGILKPCLCYDGGIHFQVQDSVEKLREDMKAAILMKPKHHCFPKILASDEKKAMQNIGG